MKRIFDAKLRKVGNSYVVTIPKDTIDRFGIEQGEYLELTLELGEKNKYKRKIPDEKR